MARLLSSSLPIAALFVRILIVLNLLVGAALLALLFIMPNRDWIIDALDLQGLVNIERVVWGLRMIAGLAIVGVGLNHVILTRLRAIIATVGAGDPFVEQNAYRLQAIAWSLLALQLLGLGIAAAARWLSAPGQEIDIDAGMSINGWLAVLLTFVLARVFAEGTLMRRDLEGTV